MKGLAVALYLLGLSYEAISLLLEALGFSMSKTLVYYTVQEAAQKVPGMRKERVMEGVRVSALGSDVTLVKVKAKWYPIGVAGEGVGKDAGALLERFASSAGGKGEYGISDSVAVIGLLGSVGVIDAVSALERAKWRADGWNQPCGGTGNWVVAEYQPASAWCGNHLHQEERHWPAC